MYVFVSHRLFLLTNDLKSVVIPSAKVSKLLWRNFGMLAVSAALLYTASLVLMRILGMSNKVVVAV